jgi:hypothetical protein
MNFSAGFRNSAPCVSALFPDGRITAPLGYGPAKTGRPDNTTAGWNFNLSLKNCAFLDPILSHS